MKLEILLRHLLPEELFEYFNLVSIEELGTKELYLHLEEKKEPPAEHKDKRLISYVSSFTRLFMLTCDISLRQSYHHFCKHAINITFPNFHFGF